MFFSNDLLTRKTGSFGVIWLAATLGTRSKRLSKKDLTAVDLSKTCELIATPPEPMALRLSGCLLVGVARVYNQTYQIFYSDVNQLNAVLRRALPSDFMSRSSGVTSEGVDLIGDGKSSFNQITFTAMGDIAHIDSDFGYINWMDPFGMRRKRRSTSKLTSLESQEYLENETEGSEEGNEEDTEDGSEIPIRREKRSKFGSSPLILNAKDAARKPSTIYRNSDPIVEDLEQNFDFPIDQPIDLGLVDTNDPGDISFSTPGRDLWRDDPERYDAGFGVNLDDVQAVPARGQDDGMEHPGHQATKRKREGNEPGSAEDPAKSKIKEGTKRAHKKVRIDDCIEQAEDISNRQSYGDSMDVAKTILETKARAKITERTAEKMVNGVGNWITFFEPELLKMFSSMSYVAIFKWQSEALNDFPGRPDDDGEKAVDVNIFADHLGDLHLTMDQNLYGDVEGTPAFRDVTYDVRRSGEREDSQLPHVRRGSQNSQMQTFPWQDSAFGRFSSDGAIPGGPDTSFTPGSLRLSIMTPQELKIRLRSRQGSLSEAPSIGHGRARSGSLTGSVIGRGADGHARMLIANEKEDFELPPDNMDLDVTASQAGRTATIPNIPEAFRPESLASLEIQCREFLSYVERSLGSRDADSLLLDDITPTSMTRRVRASAFYNCLTLATKRCLVLEQRMPFGPITIRLST